MKARVKATGEIIEVHSHSYVTELVKGGHPRSWMLAELEIEETPDPDYWDKLLHQYAGMAMQGLMAHTNIDYDEIVDLCVEFAHALVEKMKEERK